MPGIDLTFTTSDGVKLFYDDEGDGRPFVLIHGYDGMRAHWEYQRPALLEAGYRVVALDLRGHGSSDKPEHGQRMTRLGQDVRELIELLELRDVTLMGHSMGVSVSLAMMSISGLDGIAEFVAIDQSPKIVNDDEWHWGVRGITWDNAFRSVTHTEDWGGGDDELDVPVPHESSMSWSWKVFDHAKVRRLLLDHFVSDWRDVLPRIDVPSRVITGRHSPFYDVEGMEWFAAQMPKSSLVVFEESGHSPHVSEAEAFNEDLLAFTQPADAGSV